MIDWDAQPDLLTLKEVAAILRRQPNTCHKLLGLGRFPIPPFERQPYRFRAVDVRAYLATVHVGIADRRRTYFKGAARG